MKPLRTLVIEDNVEWYEDFRDNLKTVPLPDLVGPVYEVLEITHVTNQADADKIIADYHGHDYDLIFLDLNYPLTADTPFNSDDDVASDENLDDAKTLQGMKWLPELRRLQPRAAIVILTAHATDKHMKNAVDAIRDYRANDFIPKTTKFDDIAPRIRVAWERARQMQLLTKLRREFRELIRTRAIRTYAEDIGLMLGGVKTSIQSATEHLKNGDASLIPGIANTIRVELARLEDEFTALNELLTVDRSNRSEVNVVDLLQQIKDLYQGVSDSAQAKVRLLFDSLQVTVKTYEGDLTVALHEVVANALEALGKSERRPEERMLTLAVKRVEDVVVVEVTDNDGGFRKDAYAHLYERGYSTKKDADHQHQGLGLYIARRMVNHLGGAIDIESREGEGTTVRLTLRDLE